MYSIIIVSSEYNEYREFTHSHQIIQGLSFISKIKNELDTLNLLDHNFNKFNQLEKKADINNHLNTSIYRRYNEDYALLENGKESNQAITKKESNIENPEKEIFDASSERKSKRKSLET
jgi:hypothetical protein